MTATNESKEWIFVSDAHFTGQRPEEMEAFIRFAQSEMDRLERLVILGDFFEFLFGFRDAFRKDSFPFRDYLPVFECLRSLWCNGVKICYFEGNHDFGLANFFREHFDMDVEVHPGKDEKKIGGKRVFMAHGDLANPLQRGYRLFRCMLKNRLSYTLIDFVGPSLSRRVAAIMGFLSSRVSRSNLMPAPAPAFRAFAHRKFVEGYDIVILGHSHFPEEMEEWVDGRRCFYFNVGSWTATRSYLRYVPPGGFCLECWGKR